MKYNRNHIYNKIIANFRKDDVAKFKGYYDDTTHNFVNLTENEIAIVKKAAELELLKTNTEEKEESVVIAKPNIDVKSEQKTETVKEPKITPENKPEKKEESENNSDLKSEVFNTELKVFTNLKKFDRDDFDSEHDIFLPNCTKKSLSKLEKKIEKLPKNSKDELDLSEDTSMSLYGTYSGSELVNYKDIFREKINTGNWTNEVKYADESLSIQNIAAKKTNDGVVSGSRAITRFASALGFGRSIKVPLWHSGFWVYLSPSNLNNQVTLDNMIAERKVVLGKKTNTMVNSNNSVVFTEVFKEYLEGRIISHSLDIPDDEDIFDYIDINDLSALLVGLSETFFPNGLPINISCANTIHLQEDNKDVKCNYITTGKVNPKNILRVYEDGLTNKQKEHMKNKKTNSMSLDSVKEYKNNLPTIKNSILKLTTSNGVSITFILKSPTINEHIDLGNSWINDITEEVNLTLSNLEENDQRYKDALIKQSNATILNTYIHYIKSITTEEGDKIVDRDTIRDVLNMIIGDSFLYEEFIKGIYNFIGKNPISVAVIPNFKCPECEKEQSEDKENTDDPFSEFIPIDMVSAFLKILTLKIHKQDQETVI